MKKNSQVKAAPKTANLDASKSQAKAKDDNEITVAAQRVAEAFATLYEFSWAIPKSARDGVNEALDEILNAGRNGNWLCDHKVMRQCLPIILREKFTELAG